VGSDRVLHPFDADGMVTAATFSGNGTCFFRNRFVRTQVEPPPRFLPRPLTTPFTLS
jgi:carotenoid cleavage dioxygenase-like enzyme